MNRVKKDIVFWGFIILPFIITTCFLCLLPERIPTDFFAAEPEWKSKYKIWGNTLIITIVEIVYYLVFIWKVTKRVEKADSTRESAVLKNAESNNRTLMIFFFALFNIIYFTYLFLTWKITKGAQLNYGDISAVIMSSAMSVCWVVIGNAMPRMHENKDPFSNKWKNIKPQTQRKVNQANGLGLMICGGISFVITLLMHNVYTIMITFGLTFITTVILFVLSCILYEKEEKNGSKQDDQ